MPRAPEPNMGDGVGSLAPELTKLVLAYNFTNGTSGVTSKHIDYASETLKDLSFSDSATFLQTVKGVHLPEEVALSDSFLVVRNASKYSLSGDYNQAKQLSYQFIPGNIVLINSRNLSESSPVPANQTNCSNNCTNNPEAKITYSNSTLSQLKEFGMFTRMWIRN